MEAGHFFESLGRETIIKVLKTHLVDLSTDYCEAANRTFHRCPESSQIFNNMTSELEKSGWSTLNHGSAKADTIEIDFLAHIYNPGRFLLPSQGGFYSIRPLKFNARAATHAYLQRGISNEALDQSRTPNTYIVLEVTMDKKLTPGKLGQLERILTFLLCRKQEETQDYQIEIQTIISYVGIATKGNIEMAVRGVLGLPTQLPLLSTLFYLGRFIAFDIDFNYPVYLGKQFDRLNATTAAFKAFREESTRKLKDNQADLDAFKAEMSKKYDKLNQELRSESSKSSKMMSKLEKQIEVLTNLVQQRKDTKS
jgi:hypothetical protein